MARLFCDTCEAKLDAGCRPSEIKGCKVCPPPPHSSEYRRKHKAAMYCCDTPGCEEMFLDLTEKAIHMSKHVTKQLDQSHAVEYAVSGY